MKAIHVANTSDSRIYYLLESDDDSTGVVIKPNSPPTFVNFFSYVSKKPRIRRVMDSDFHEFLWTGNKGSLKPRWESIFIDRVGNTDNLLSGVEVVTKFSTDTGPNRVEQMNAKANRAIEYRALLAAGLNEKAFARGAGRMASRIASGSVRGFRRGVRFDPTAVDADMDGFVQEGTQFARPATPRIRTDLTPQRGMRSSKTTFIPPRPPTPNSRTQTPDQVKKARAALKEWQESMNALNAIIGFNDPDEILETWDDWESELSELIGRPIKTAEDAREVAALLHTGFHPSRNQTMAIVTGALTGRKQRKYRGTGSYFTLLDPNIADNETYNIYEKHQLIAVLHALKSNPSLQNHTLRIVADDREPNVNPTVQGRASAQQAMFPGHRWRIDKQKVADLKKQRGGTREERNALIAADVPSFIEPIPGSERASMVAIGYRPQEDFEDIWHLTRAILDGDTDKAEYAFNAFGKSEFNTANAHGLSLVAHADSLPEEQRAAMLSRAVAVTMGLIVTHELHGHGAHSVASEKHMFDLLKEMREISNADSIKFTRAVEGAFKNLKEKLVKNKHSDKITLDLSTTALDSSVQNPSGYSTAVGIMGPAIESLGITGGDSRLPALISSHLSIGQWIRFAEDFGGRAKLDEWLAQPILDANGDSYKATKGLVQYFEGIGKAARKEWGVDLRLKEGDELTLAHVLFGLNPHENNSQLLTIGEDLAGMTGSIPTHRKGSFSGDQSQHLRHADREIYPIDITDVDVFRSRDATGGEVIDPSSLTQLKGVRKLPQDPNIVGIPHGVPPPVAVFRRKGLPEINDTKPKQDMGGKVFTGTSKTEAVSPEDAAPLLDAYSVATHVLAQSKASLQEDLENLLSGHPSFINLDEAQQLHLVHKMFFQQMVDIKMDTKRSSKTIGTTGKQLSEFVDGKSEHQREELRQEIVDAMLEALFFERIPGGTPQRVEAFLADVVQNLDSNDGRNLAIMLQQITQAASQWDDLSDSRVQALKNIVGDMGYRQYASYAGAKTAHHILEELLGTGRDELVAELMTAMKAGIDIPLWGADGKRRGLTPAEVDALQSLHKWLVPDVEPKIRANGETYV